LTVYQEFDKIGGHVNTLLSRRDGTAEKPAEPKKPPVTSVRRTDGKVRLPAVKIQANPDQVSKYQGERK
jgi:hypothetical protein